MSKLSDIETELARTRTEYAELQALLGEWQARIAELESARAFDLVDVPVSEIRARMVAQAEAESRLPALRQSVRELERRGRQLAVDVNLLDNRRHREIAIVHGREAADLLLSGPVVSALETIETAAQVWPNRGSQNMSMVGRELPRAREALKALIDAASQA